MTIQLTLDEVVADLRAIVAEKGEGYVYPNYSCVYFEPTGEPSCVVGQVMARHGVSREDLDSIAVRTRWLNSSAAVRLFAEGIIDCEPEVRGLLMRAQDISDSHDMWGAILDLLPEGEAR